MRAKYLKCVIGSEIFSAFKVVDKVVTIVTINGIEIEIIKHKFLNIPYHLTDPDYTRSNKREFEDHYQKALKNLSK